MKKGIKIAVIAVSSLVLACVAGLAVTGWQIGWGPFAGLYDWETREVTPVAAKYPAAERQHEGRLLWRDGYIQPQMEDLIQGFELEHLRRMED